VTSHRHCLVVVESESFLDTISEKLGDKYSR